MTVSTSANRADYLGNGATTAFPVPFYFPDATSLKVLSTVIATGVSSTLVLNSDYTVSGAGVSTGGTVTTTVAPANGVQLSILLNLAYTQNTHYVPNDPFPAASHEAALDYLTLLSKQTAEVASRSIAIPPGEVGTSVVLPPAAGRLGTLLGFDSVTGALTLVAQAIGSAGALAVQYASSVGASLIGFIQSGVGAVLQTLQSELRSRPITPQQFGAKGDGTTIDTAAFTAMFTDGRPWLIPPGDYLIDAALFINANGICYGRLIAKTGFTGRLVTICNPTYGVRRHITGLSVYSQDVRPNPYTGAATTGIYVGPTATYLGNTPCPNVTLIACSSTRFSYGVDIATFNVECYSCQFYQNDHNGRVYSTDLTNNQINDVRLVNCAMDSAQSSVGQAYALRIGTAGNATYASSTGMGYSLTIQGCNFDGAPVYIDNVIGITIGGPNSYCEQASGYTYHGGAIVLGSAGANTLQQCKIEGVTFNQFDYAIVLKNTVLGLVVGPNNCSAVKYRELLAVGCESQGFTYRRGTSIGSFNANTDAVGTNFSSGISTSQITFSNITIDSDFLSNGVQLAPAQVSTTSWYPRGMTLDGWQSQGSSVGRFRSGSAVQSAIAGNQVGQVFTFTTQAQASLFCGGDTITSSAGGATKILSVDYVAGTAVLDSTFTGACTLSHTTAYFVGYNLSGNGSPAGVVTANPGSRYANLSGGAGTTTYVKETGVGTNTGWVAK